MSEYRTPEEDTIGGQSDLDDEDEQEPGSAASEQEGVEPTGQPD